MLLKLYYVSAPIKLYITNVTKSRKVCQINGLFADFTVSSFSMKTVIFLVKYVLFKQSTLLVKQLCVVEFNPGNAVHSWYTPVSFKSRYFLEKYNLKLGNHKTTLETLKHFL